MKVVGAFEAKNKLGHLARPRRAGARKSRSHGTAKTSPELVPARSRPGRDQARAAIQRIRERAEAAKLGRFDWAEWKAYRDEGRP